MIQSARNLPILYYVIEIAGREFPLVIRPDGISQWDDHTGRRRIRHPDHQYLELRAFSGDRRALAQLQNELLEFSISVEVPRELFLKAVKMAQREQGVGMRTAGPQRISLKTARDITEMDQLLTKFFWKEVNPLLCQPIKI